jgi:hypothetical protein
LGHARGERGVHADLAIGAHPEQDVVADALLIDDVLMPAERRHGGRDVHRPFAEQNLDRLDPRIARVAHGIGRRDGRLDLAVPDPELPGDAAFSSHGRRAQQPGADRD